MNASTDQSSEKNPEFSLAQEPTNQQNKPRLSVALAVTSAILLIISSVMIYISLSSYIKGLLALQYKLDDATVVKIVEQFDAIGVRKQAELRFSVKGKEVHALTELPQDRVMKPGELTVIYYDRNNPQNVVLSQEIDYDTVEVLGAFGFFLFCFGTLAAIKARRKAEPGST